MDILSHNVETTLQPLPQADRLTGRLDFLTNDTFNDISTYINNFSNTDLACLTYYLENDVVKVSHAVFVYVSTLFVALGLVGNFLSLLVFWSPEMRNISSNVYLFVLSLSDSAYLLTVFFTKILTTLRCMHFANSNVDFYNRSLFFCKLLQFMLDLFSDYSSCLILAFTVERYLACYHALKFRAMSSTLRARIFCIALFVVISVTTLPYHIKCIGKHLGYDVCLILPEYEAIFIIFYCIEAMIFRVLPVFVIAVLNILISVKVIKLHRKRNSRRAVSKDAYSLTDSGHAREGRRWTLEERQLQITIMLIVVSTSYVVLFFPVMIHFIIYRLQPMSYDHLAIFENISKTLYVGGFAINFFLYTVSCKTFREQLLHVLFGNRKVYKEVRIHDETSGANVHNGVTDHENPKTTQTHV